MNFENDAVISACNWETNAAKDQTPYGLRPDDERTNLKVVNNLYKSYGQDTYVHSQEFEQMDRNIRVFYKNTTGFPHADSKFLYSSRFTTFFEHFTKNIVENVIRPLIGLVEKIAKRQDVLEKEIDSLKVGLIAQKDGACSSEEPEKDCWFICLICSLISLVCSLLCVIRVFKKK